MQRNIWRSLLSVRTFFRASSGVGARKLIPVSAVPRPKKQAGVISKHVKGHLGAIVAARREQFSSQSNGKKARALALGGKPDSGFFPESKKQRTLLVLRPHFSFSKSNPDPVEKTIRRTAPSGIALFSKRIARSNVKQVRAIAVRHRVACSAGREALSAKRRPVAIAHMRPKGLVKPTGAKMHSAVRLALKADGGLVGVPLVRKQPVEVQTSEWSGPEHDLLQDFAVPRNHYEAEALSHRPEHEVRTDDFSSGNRRGRLAARRSGGGVDEIMQPQYPGRSIGFF